MSVSRPESADATMGSMPVNRVLIVEDRPDVRLALRFMLEASDYQVVEAADGAEALDRIAREEVDLILTDLYMPEMDGLSLVRAVRGGGQRQPKIIAMSGSPNLGKEAALEAAQILGADAILRKPFSKDQLVQAIHDIANRSQELN